MYVNHESIYNTPVRQIRWDIICWMFNRDIAVASKESRQNN